MMIYGALLGCLQPVLIISAAIAHKSPFVSNFEDKSFPLDISVSTFSKKRFRDESDQIRAKFAGHHQSDLIAILNAYNEWNELKGKEKLYFLASTDMLRAML